MSNEATQMTTTTFQVFASEDDGNDRDLGTFGSLEDARAAMVDDGNGVFWVNTFEDGRFVDYFKVWLRGGIRKVQ